MDGDHTTANIDTDGRRDDSSLGRNYRTNGRTNAHMDVRHNRDMSSEDGELRHITQLVLRGVLDFHITDPHFYVGDHFLFTFSFSTQHGKLCAASDKSLRWPLQNVVLAEHLGALVLFLGGHLS